MTIYKKERFLKSSKLGKILFIIAIFMFISSNSFAKDIVKELQADFDNHPTFKNAGFKVFIKEFKHGFLTLYEPKRPKKRGRVTVIMGSNEKWRQMKYKAEQLARNYPGIKDVIWFPLNEPKKGHDIERARIGEMFPFPTIIVNLKNNGEKHFIKLSFQLELKSNTVIEELNNSLPLIKEKIVNMLNKSKNDVNSPKGKFKLKEEIRSGINDMLTEKSIKNIYFTEFAIQDF